MNQGKRWHSPLTSTTPEDFSLSFSPFPAPLNDGTAPGGSFVPHVFGPQNLSLVAIPFSSLYVCSVLLCVIFVYKNCFSLCVVTCFICNIKTVSHCFRKCGIHSCPVTLLGPKGRLCVGPKFLRRNVSASLSKIFIYKWESKPNLSSFFFHFFPLSSLIE